MENYWVIGIMIFVGFVFFLMFLTPLSNKKGTQEGLVNMDGSGNSPPGLGANATEYNIALSNYVGKMNDVFLISKYKKEYENVVLNLENISNYMMLQSALSIQTTPNISADDLLAQFKTLNELKQSQDSLNVLMKFIDSQ